MSFCPTRDIHSVYLDNELSDEYKAEYEAHIANCPKCKAELEKYRALRGMFQHDAESVTPDVHYLDQSFERLQVKMKFSKNTGSYKKSKFNFNYIYYGSVAAAAAAFAFIVPLRMGTGNADNVAPATAIVSSIPFTATNATNVSFDSGRSTVISGNIERSVLSSASVQPKNNQRQRVQNVAFNNGINESFIGGSSVIGSEDLKVRRNEDETISIKITVPGMNAVPVVTEINLPMDVISGRF